MFTVDVKQQYNITSCCSYARPAQPGPIQWLGPLLSDSVNKLVSILFGKCTTLVVTNCWPVETRLPCGDQWKAEKLGAFWRWPITRCVSKSDKAGLIVMHSMNFRLNGEHWRAVQLQKNRYTSIFSRHAFVTSCLLTWWTKFSQNGVFS